MTQTPIDREQLLARVRNLSGLSGDAPAERALRAVLSVLSEQLDKEDRAALSQLLPAAFAESLAHTPLRIADDARAFYERVSHREGVELGFAIEHAQSVCAALGEALDEEPRQWLVRRLPDALAPLFEPPARERIERTAKERPASPAGRTLASGRPGSTRPLSEAHPTRAQQDSVARSEEPHADTKLSSARGTTQEREGETLAEGRTKARRE